GTQSGFPQSQIFPFSEAAFVAEPHIGGYQGMQQAGRAYALLRSEDGDKGLDETIDDPIALVDSIEKGLISPSSPRYALRNRVLTFYVDPPPVPADPRLHEVGAAAARANSSEPFSHRTGVLWRIEQEQDAMNLLRIAAAQAVLAAALIASAGCSKSIVSVVPVNQPPSVRITSAPLDTTQRNYYVITLNWIGFDPDGRVDHFLYAIDPPRDPGSDTLWTTTTENTLTKFFPCPLPDRRNAFRSSDFHVFVIKAVDNRAALSPPVARAFWSYTLAPTVRCSAPSANARLTY